MACPICCDNFTDVTRKEVKCNYCNYSSCVKCVKQYLLTISQDPNCMNCHMAWNREFIDGVCSKTFMTNDFKKHREVLLLDREKSLLPDTVPYVEAEVRKRDNVKFIEELKQKRDAMKREISKLNEQIYRLHYGQYTVIDGVVVPAQQQASTSKPQEERRAFVRNCVVDGCRGFLSTQWKCGVCSTWVCPDCHEVKQCQKDEHHVCNPDNVASAKLISQSTKPCPKCAAPILKVSGCDQMWCTLCHTAFSWKTGDVVTVGRIHNPHYFEWARANNVELPRFDDPNPNAGCDNGYQHVRYNDLHNFTRMYSDTDDRIRKLNSLYRVMTHIYDIELRHFNTRRDLRTANRDLRVKYLLKEIDEADWKKTLQQREKRHDFDMAKHQVFEMFYRVGTDLVGRVTQMSPKIQGKLSRLRTALTEIDGLVEYYNASLAKVNERFNSKSNKMLISARTWEFQKP